MAKTRKLMMLENHLGQLDISWRIEDGNSKAKIGWGRGLCDVMVQIMFKKFGECKNQAKVALISCHVLAHEAAMAEMYHLLLLFK